MILPQDNPPGADAEVPSPAGLSPRQQEDFVCLLNAAHGRLLRFVVSLVARRQDAEDILQRASVTMWRRFHQFETGTDFIAWATTIASYEVKNFHRVSGRSKVLFDEELMQTLAHSRVPDLQYCDARLDALEDCVQKLDQSSRGLIDAVYSRGEEVQDLARREGRAPQTFYNRLNVIRRMLTECMRRKVVTPSP
ncbi:MAG: hypothetical protein RLZZ399_2213 [Verrucomicrobiota bacterium]|jgi:RNA polymerase sigma-70 factor (ECF subfamily)